MDESNIQLTINLNDPNLDEDQREKMTQRLLREMPGLDGVENPKLVKDENLSGEEMAFLGFVPGMIGALVTPKNLLDVLKYLISFSQGKYIEVEAEFNGIRVKFKAKDLQDLENSISSLRRMGLVVEGV